MAILALAAWMLFAFGGRDLWVDAVFIGAAVTVAAFFRPRFSSSHSAVDIALSACLAFGAAQLVPLPPAIRFALSPASRGIDRALLMTPPSDPAHGPAHPLTIDATATMWSLALAAAVVLTFWSARATFERRGGLRLTVRTLGWMGLIVAVVTFAQRHYAPHLFYGIWHPVARTDSPTPFGPFLSRNDLASWLILAVPLETGYVMTRIRSRAGFESAANIDAVLDSRMLLLLASILLMLALLLSTGSRAGVIGCGAGLLMLLALSRSRMPGRQFLWFASGLVLAAALAAAYINVPMLVARFNDALAPDLGRGRFSIWRTVWPLAADFARTGAGIGAFERGMIVYEPRPFTLFINQAHDEYLQILVEGGVPLVVLVGAVLVAGWREARRRIQADRTPVGWLRAGAVSGIVAIGVQSIWDTGLRMPANAVLFAVLAAIALHSGSRE